MIKMPSKLRHLVHHLGRVALTLLLAGLLGVSLVRLAPGFDSDERELDPHLSAASLAALRAKHESNVFLIYGRFLAGAAHGDLGASESLGGAPVASLLKDRLPVTFASISLGLALAWFAGLLFAALGSGFEVRLAAWTATAGTEFLLAIPAGLIALLLFLAATPASSLTTLVPALGIGLAVFPQIYKNASRLVAEAAARPHVLSARARGIRTWRIFWLEILPAAGPQLLALAGTSVTLALGAAIPVETICDSAGLGQLAWKAATARDINLLVPLILTVSAVTLLANTVADLAIGDRQQEERPAAA